VTGNLMFRIERATEGRRINNAYLSLVFPDRPSGWFDIFH